MADKVFTGFSGHPGVREPPPPADPPVNVDIPYVSGVGAVGEMLECTMGNWIGEPNLYAYKWKYKQAVNVVIAQGPTYAIKQLDEGKDVFCAVTATNDAGSTDAPPSNAVFVEPSARSGTHATTPAPKRK